MAQHDPETPSNSPRAPSQAAWDAMSPEQRRRVVESLPSWMPEEEAAPPEGDFHADARFGAREGLRGFFGKLGRGVYVGSDLIVYYPDTRRFAPDLLVVFDVEPGPRDKWVVSDEGKGLDFVMEVLYSGDRAKDLEENVAFYAQLGIPEYFVYDRRRQRIHGFRLPAGGSRYLPIVPLGGRYASEALGLDVTIEDDKLRFYHANARVYEPVELLERVQRTFDQVERRLEEEQRLREEEQRLREEEQRLREEEQRLREEEQRLREEEQRLRVAAERRLEEEQRAREEAQRQLAAALEELDRLKRSR